MTQTPSDTTDFPSTPDGRLPAANSFEPTAVWWIQVARVRLRFVLIVAFVGVVVSQWSILRGVWDRWTWASNQQHASGSVSSSHEYFCPMDPGVISVWPAICPICNMDLVPRKKMEAVMLPEGVISRMQLSPYRIQLAGIRTSVIEPRSLKFERRFSGVIRKAEDGSIGFDDDLAESDRLLFLARQSAEVRTQDLSPPVAATACVVDNSTSPRLRVALNESRALPIGTVVMANVCLNFGDGGDQLAVPESAVVDRGRERLVYVETMPGQFDGVAVELSRRCGSYYPVLHGLKPGQRVASAGAFLIDAETRLNPSLATGYFGASQSGSTASPSPPAALTAPAKAPLTKSSPSKKTLSREDQALADQQRICPVTELPLNSMGGPVPAIVGGRKVFICCTGCEKRLKDDPEKYLARLSPK